MKKIFAMFFATVMLSACASSKYDKAFETGRILEVNKIDDKDISPKSGTAVGTGVGIGAGALIGGALGVGAGAAAALGTFGLLTPMIPAMGFAGAVYGGVVGGAAGATGGYISDYVDAGDGLFEYKVIQLSDHKELLVRQVEKEPKKKGEFVRIVWDTDRLIILPLNKE